MSDENIIIDALASLKEQIGDQYLLSSQNGAELISHPSPLSFDIFKKINSYHGSMGIAYKNLGIEIQPFDESKYAINFLGRIFLNLKEEERFLHQNIGYHYHLSEDEATLQPFKKNIANSLKLIKYSYKQASLVSKLNYFLNEFAKFNQKMQQLPPLDLSLDKDDSIKYFNQELTLFIQEYSQIFQAAFLEQIIFQLAGRKYTKNQIQRHLTQLKGNKQDPDQYLLSSLELQSCLSKNGDLNHFLQKYGQRAFDDFELSCPRFAEIKQALVDLANISRAVMPKQELTESSQPPKLIGQLHSIITAKNNLRLHILHRFFRLRQLLLKLDSEYKLKGNIFYLQLDELLDLPTIKLNDLQARKNNLIAFQNIPLPSIITPQADLYFKKTNYQSSIHITPVSSGKVIGQTALIKSPLDDLPFGKIAIFPNANPDFTHLYNQAKAIIFLKGSELSHGSIIAREMNIPAGILRDQTQAHKILNKKISFDADQGSIQILEG